VTIVYLALFYDGLKRMVLGLDDWLVASNRRLLTFVAAIFVLPVFFLLSGALIGPIAR
jgi:hypothetical protein